MFDFIMSKFSATISSMESIPFPEIQLDGMAGVRPKGRRRRKGSEERTSTREITSWKISLVYYRCDSNSGTVSIYRKMTDVLKR